MSSNALYTDEEDLFMICDLLTGGDLRYHLLQQVCSFDFCVKFIDFGNIFQELNSFFFLFFSIQI